MISANGTNPAASELESSPMDTEARRTPSTSVSEETT
jgi:hypothetical protein